MPEYIFLMHGDADDDETAWGPYLRRLEQSGCFQGGSAIGEGICVPKRGGRRFVDGAFDGVLSRCCG
jgi:hypothetical protein